MFNFLTFIRKRRDAHLSPFLSQRLMNKISYILVVSFMYVCTFPHTDNEENNFKNGSSSRSSIYHIKVKQGILKGVLSESRNKTQYISFYGIPFAKPPIDELRFQPPHEPDPWEGVRDASKTPPICIQSDLYDIQKTNEDIIEGQEDCLYLNVFAPNVTFSTLLPVIVFIHGGGFHSLGSNFYGPEYFMDYPVVIVIIQYRLAILGFLSAGDETLPGNYGLKDQVAALKWLQENIEAFGGDRKRVTISGESAGGASVHFHLLSFRSTGLFHRAISQSGTAFAACGTIKQETARQRAKALGILTGCPELETKPLVECLRKIPAEQLVVAHRKFFIYDRNPSLVFGPVIEPTNAADAFLVEDPWKQNVVNNVPLIIGFNADEGGLIASRIRSLPAVLNEWTKYYDRMFPLILYYFDRIDLKNSIASITESIKSFYFGEKDISDNTGSNLSQMFMDGYFAAPALETALRHDNTVFFYLYDHLNGRSCEEFYGYLLEDHGAAHGDDLISLFTGPFPFIDKGPDFEVSRRMISYWVNFAKDGDPNGNERIWHPFAPEKINYLHIKTDSDSMQEELMYDRYIFWKKNVFSKLHP